MNKRIFKLLIVLLSLMQLTGCSNFTDSQKLKAPTNKNIPIKGTYKLLQKDDKKNIAIENKTFSFKEDEFSDNNDVYKNVKYKIRVVDMAEYLLYGYRIENTINKGKEVKVVSVISNERFLYDFIKVDDENIMLISNGAIHRLVKVKDDYVELPSWKRNFSSLIGSSKPKYAQGETALYLGLRQKEGDKLVYKTIFIGTLNGEVKDIYSTNNIFLPRKNGFWRINLEDNSQIKVENVTKQQSTVENKINDSIMQSKIMTNKAIKVDYVGNDYMCLEENNGLANVLKVVPVDNPMQEKGVTIGDLLGEKYTQMFDEAREEILKDIKEKGDEIYQDIKYQNIGILRKNGRFLLKGRINYQTKQTAAYTDFNTGFIPPLKMVAFDQLTIPMNEIKNEIPQAIDAYTSPNGDIALVILPRSIEIYKIKDLKLSEKQAEIKINKDDKIIMVEWATGAYSSIWKENFIKNNSVDKIK